MKDNTDEYLLKKEINTVTADEGVTKTRTEFLFGITSDRIEFKEGSELNVIKLDSIVKIYQGTNLEPERLYISLEDGRDISLPEWILDEFSGIAEELAMHSGLVKTEGPDITEKSSSRTVRYAGWILGAFLLSMCILTLFIVPTFLYLPSFFCFLGIFSLLFGIGCSIYIVYILFKGPEKKNMWERPSCKMES